MALIVVSRGGGPFLVADDHGRVRDGGNGAVPCAESAAVAAAVVGAAVGVVAELVHRRAAAPQRHGAVHEGGEHKAAPALDGHAKGVGGDGGGGGAVGVGPEPAVGKRGGDGDEPRRLAVAHGAAALGLVGRGEGIGAGVMRKEGRVEG